MSCSISKTITNSVNQGHQREAVTQDIEPFPEDAQPLPEDEEIVSISASRWRGPIPPPSVLEGYESVLPGAAERILANFEAESAHRRRLEASTQEQASSRSRLGLLAGYCVAAMLIALAAYALFKGYSWQAVAILGGGLGTAVSIFVTGSKSASRQP